MGGATNTQRRAQVQILRRYAFTYQVQRVSDNAKREAVQTMYRALLAKPTLTEEDKSAVQTAVAAFEGSFGPEQPGQNTQVANVPGTASMSPPKEAGGPKTGGSRTGSGGEPKCSDIGSPWTPSSNPPFFGL